MKKLAIIGGGASGLAAAIVAAREVRAHGAEAEVVLYEADERVGRSVLATGNGRCNFSNTHIDAKLYRNAAFVGDALEELMRQCTQQRGAATVDESDKNPVHEFLADLGLVWREEAEGRLYPLANKAASVLDVLRAAASDAGVHEECERAAVRVDAPTQAGGRFHVRFADGTVAHADDVIVAVGGRAATRLALPDELHVVPGRAVLGPLLTDTQVTKPLNNIRVRCAVSLVGPDGAVKAREEGELLFRDYGVSGVAVFNLSRFEEVGDALVIDFLPRVRACDLESVLFTRRKRMTAHGRTLTCEGFLCGLLLPQVARAVLREADLRPEAPFNKANVAALARALKSLSLTVRGMGDARQCQIWRGGVAVEAFDARTMEAQAVPGLYVVGEALDVDAPCGGYNLHWAWASGMLAGHAAVERLADGESRA